MFWRFGSRDVSWSLEVEGKVGRFWNGVGLVLVLVLLYVSWVIMGKVFKFFVF